MSSYVSACWPKQDYPAHTHWQYLICMYRKAQTCLYIQYINHLLYIEVWLDESVSVRTPFVEVQRHRIASGFCHLWSFILPHSRQNEFLKSNKLSLQVSGYQKAFCLCLVMTQILNLCSTNHQQILRKTKISLKPNSSFCLNQNQMCLKNGL